MPIISSGQITLTDLNDSKQLILYLNGNYKSQVYDPNTTNYAPSFTANNLIITPELYIAGGDGSNLLPNAQVQSVTWYEGTQTATPLAETATTGTTPVGYTYNIPTGAVGTTAKPLTIKSNITAGNSQIYTCVIVYRDPDTSFDVTAKASFEIVKITNGSAGIDALQVILSNENATVPTDKNGANGVYTATGSNVYLYEGTTALTYDGVGTSNGTWKMTASGSGITAGSVTDGGVYGVLGVASAITQDAATITLTITGKRQDGTAISITKTQTLTRVKSGQDPTSYWLVIDASAIQKAASGAYTPASINLTGKSQVGSGTPGNYSARFIIADTTDGSTFTDRYTSAGDEATKAYTPSAGIKALRVRMYLAGGTSTLLDEQLVPVVSDGTQSVLAYLTNEASTIATDQNGANGVYTGTGAEIHVYDGATELAYDGTGTANGTWKVTASASGITAGSITDSGLYATIGTASAISADQATVTYTITGKSNSGAAFTLTKIQTFSRAKTGVAPTAYWLVTDVSAFQKNVSNVLSPASVVMTSKSQTGGNAPGNYSGRFIIAETTDGSAYTDKYTSASDENTKTYTPSSSSIKAVRIRLYQAGGVTNLLDEQIIPIVSDGATGIDAYFLNVWAPGGDTVRNSAANITLQADMYKGAGTVTPTAFKWYVQDPTATTASGGDADGQNGWRLINTVANPTTAPTLALQANANTQLAAQTYYVKYTWLGLSGETIGSTEASLAVTAGNDLKVTIPAFGTNVTAARVYIGTATGVLYYAGTINASAGNIVITKFDNSAEAIPTVTTASAVTSATLTVRPWAIAGVEGFKCVATAPTTGIKYTGVIVVRDVQDPIAVNILGTNIFKNGQGNITLTVQLLQAGVEISNAGYTFSWALYNPNGTLIKTYPTTTDTITIAASDVTGTANLVVDVNKA